MVARHYSTTAIGTIVFIFVDAFQPSAFSSLFHATARIPPRKARYSDNKPAAEFKQCFLAGEVDALAVTVEDAGAEINVTLRPDRRQRSGTESQSGCRSDAVLPELLRGTARICREKARYVGEYVGGGICQCFLATKSTPWPGKRRCRSRAQGNTASGPVATRRMNPNSSRTDRMQCHSIVGHAKMSFSTWAGSTPVSLASRPWNLKLNWSWTTPN